MCLEVDSKEIFYRHAVNEMIQMLDSNNIEVSVMPFRRDHQTTLSCKSCETAVVNVREKAFKGQVRMIEMNKTESLLHVETQRCAAKSRCTKNAETSRTVT